MKTAEFLNELVAPHAVVDADADFWMPRGFDHPQEAKLGKSEGLLSAEHREAVTAWWLAIRRMANTPNWDLASTCMIEGRRGLILVEAKAHVAELTASGKKPGNPENEVRIRSAIAEANAELNERLRGWNLSADSHYQLCNRFAWSWKIASLGVPVVLVYLGFLNASEMKSGASAAFHAEQDWGDCVATHCEGVVPSRAWQERINVGGTAMYALVRSIDMGAGGA